MDHNIEAIFLDVGNTLRIVIEDDAFQEQAKKDLMQLVEAKETPEVFFEELNKRWKVYRNQSKKSLIEASEKELWSKWLLPHYPTEKIAPLAGKLTRLWRDHDGRRVPRPDVTKVVLELSRRGYILGIIANTITETEIPDWLISDGLADYFKLVVLSSKVGIRKPNPQIYWDAAKNINVAPECCAYIGDNPVRDVEGTQLAGFGLSIILIEPDTMKKEPPTDEHKPDFLIKELSDLLDIFPQR
ncbi:MAG: hypothetical protein CVU39_18660 [Chloroflexi bacterium HGW-Chloroflexi-10]|nr:MAG: hypothetical protein CVU39_18660 [Chloroflexi bacterium HGW-Chloroflexi-10]